MTQSIELQMISRILTSQSGSEIDRLCGYDISYYSVFTKEIEFILKHKDQYGDVPDVFTFQAQFPEFVVVDVHESLNYLETEIRRNKQHILLIQTFNKLTDLGSDDVEVAWEYLAQQCDAAAQLDSNQPMNIVKDAQKRSDQVVEYSKQTRIPTGFDEIDEAMYGGLSTVEELLVMIARTNTGKSWVCTKMMESAQKAGFPTLYYSPEMRACFIGTRFDTWRAHYKNNELFQGRYTEEYKQYIKELVHEETGAYVVEDADMPDGVTTVRGLDNLVKRLNIKLVIVDGLSYVSDGKVYTSSGGTTLAYKHICDDLFKMSKIRNCAVVVAMQANRETKDNKDEKGEPFPNLYNAEGSDHPGRIATQAFSMRQLYDTNTLEIKMEKSRSAKNSKRVFSYIWDPNTGTTKYVPDDSSSSPGAATVAPSAIAPTVLNPKIVRPHDDAGVIDNSYEEEDDDVTF